MKSQIPISLDGLNAKLDIIPPVPLSIEDHGSIWVRCCWHTGILWWRKEHNVVQEFVYNNCEFFWPGVQFSQVSSSVWLQLKNLLEAYHSKQKAMNIYDTL